MDIANNAVLLLIVCILIVIGILGTIWYGFNRYKTKSNKFERWEFTANFLITLLAIFIGAFLALQFENMHQIQLQKLQEEKERQNLLASINLSINEIEDQIRELESFSDYLKNKNSEEAKRILNTNPTQDVITIDILIGNPLFAKYCAPIGTGTIISFNKKKTQWLDVANDPTVTLESNFSGMKIYIEYLEDLKGLLSTEIDYVGGNITEAEVLESLDSLHHINISENKTGEEIIEYKIVPVRLNWYWWLIIGCISAIIAIIAIYLFRNPSKNDSAS